MQDVNDTIASLYMCKGSSIYNLQNDAIPLIL